MSLTGMTGTGPGLIASVVGTMVLLRINRLLRLVLHQA
jgi:uncharacterized membrane protein YeaQ/YmgE (transglycosylase-associated protein family)